MKEIKLTYKYFSAINHDSENYKVIPDSFTISKSEQELFNLFDLITIPKSYLMDIELDKNECICFNADFTIQIDLDNAELTYKFTNVNYECLDII